jgi:hypothetical protein
MNEHEKMFRFGYEREEVAGECRKLHNEELHGFCSSPYIIHVIELRRVRWVQHLAHTGGET